MITPNLPKYYVKIEKKSELAVERPLEAPAKTPLPYPLFANLRLHRKFANY